MTDVGVPEKEIATYEIFCIKIFLSENLSSQETGYLDASSRRSVSETDSTDSYMFICLLQKF